MRFRTFAFIGIVLLATFLRLYKLGSVPASPDWDEASLGYNAYSILKTGRDEYGSFLPLSIRSFGDYKPPLYAYLTVPSVALFGLNVPAVRLPSALMGILAVAGTYFLVRQLLRGGKWEPESEPVALVSALLLALSPWHLQFSRAAFEANTGITLNVWGTYFFLRGLARGKYLAFSAVCFGLALWAYHSERVFVPLLGIGLVLIHRREIFARGIRKWVFAAAAVVLLSVSVLGVSLVSGGLSRLQGTSWLSNQTDMLKKVVLRADADGRMGDKIGAVFDNRRFVFAKTFADGYLSHFSLKWLFTEGDNARHHAPDMGLMYLVEMPFFLYGIWRFATTRDASGKLIVWWILISPVAAAVTTGLPHAIRTLVFLPVIQTLTAMGLVDGFAAAGKLGKSRGWIRTALVGLVLLAFGYNVAYYLAMYYGAMNREYSEFWQYGYAQAVSYTETHGQTYSRIVVSTKLDQSYIFFLFYGKEDPAAYLALGGTKPDHVRFGKYEFRTIDWQSETWDGRTLYIGTPEEMSGTVNPVTVRYLNGKAAIVMADR
jgi:4-amino-4-deoxy-L-arabinose transferase-like glycosyltransferase